jgi:hypothetical protein
VIGDEPLLRRVYAALADIFGDLGAEQIDEAMLRRLLIEPGQVGTRRELYADFSLASRINDRFANAGFPDADFLMAHIDSRAGFEGNLFVASLAHARTFSEIERAQLSMLADLTSFALSGCVPRRSA